MHAHAIAAIAARIAVLKSHIYLQVCSYEHLVAWLAVTLGAAQLRAHFAYLRALFVLCRMLARVLMQIYAVNP